MRNIRHEFLEWAVGIFCVLVGAMMLIVPHQFNTPSYSMLRPALDVWGVLFVMAGGLLLFTAVFKPHFGIVVFTHIAAGGLLLLLALGFAQVSALSGITHYTVLGLGTLFAPFLAKYPSEAHRSDDAFGIVMAVAAAVTGFTIFFFPNQFNATIIENVRVLIPGMGIAFLTTGLFACAVLLAPRVPNSVYKLAFVSLGGVFILWFLQMALPIRALTGYPYYGGMGLLLITLPWLQNSVYKMQTDSLRVRFALVLAVLTIVPLLTLAFLYTEQQVQVAAQQALNYQQRIATAQSDYVASLLGLYRSANDAFAAQPGLLQMSREDQAHVTLALKQAYPDVLVFALRDAENNLIIRSDGVTQVAKVDPDPLYQKVLTTNRPAIRVGWGPVYQRFLLVFASPIYGEQGELAGLAIMTIDTSRFSALLSDANANGENLVYLVDEDGKVIFHPDPTLVQQAVDLSQTIPVSTMFANGESSGSMTYTPPNAEPTLVGYARVPGVGWGIVVERSEAGSLAAVRTGRELSLLLLILVCVSALVIGTWLSQSLTVPLWKVANALNQLPADSSRNALMWDGVAEVKLLTNAFNDLRERLARRTEERNLAEKRLVFLAEATNVLNASLDFEQTLRAIAKMAVPALGDWCTVDIVDDNGTLQQVAVVHTDPETQALVTEWREKELQKPHDVDLGRHVLQTGESVLIPELPAGMLEGVAMGNEASLKLLSALNLLSALCVPLAVRGQRIGVLFLNTSRDSERRLNNDDLILVEELARRASTAIDNAKLYREAQNAIHMRDEFLSVAAHELKTPVTSLRGFAQMTLRHIATKETPDVERIQTSLKRIEQQSDKLARLISQLLDVSRFMGGSLAIEPREIELVSLVQTVVTDAQLNTQRHTIRLSGLAECRIVGDPLRLEQVLTNLVDNAIKYSPNGGDILVNVSLQPESQHANGVKGANGRSSGNILCVSVTDHGLGVPVPAREHIFNRFFQAHKEGHYGGMGLGLYISRQIIELHNGTLDAEYPTSGGTRFVICLPVLKQTESDVLSNPV
jgi:signal transduction histidine kinase